MKATMTVHFKQAGKVAILSALLLWLASPTLAKDTDIYKVNTKQNCYVLMDNSESMNFGVYQYTIDYAKMFNYLFTLNDSAVNTPSFGTNNYKNYIYDTFTNSNTYYTTKYASQKIYLLRGAIGLTTTTVNGVSTTFTGDAADPDYAWSPFSPYMIDTHTQVGGDGHLQNDGSGTSLLTVDTDGYVRYNNQLLAMGMSIKEADFIAQIQAPGYYFSGVYQDSTNIYFFVTGNWINMQAMYNLHYTGTPSAAAQARGATIGAAAWMYEVVPLDGPDGVGLWAPYSDSSLPLKFPATGNYASNIIEGVDPATTKTLYVPGAQKIQIHFSAFNVKGDGDGNSTTHNNDYVKIYDQNGAVVVTLDNDNYAANTTSGTLNQVITGSKAVVKFQSNSSAQSTNGTGYTIDKISVVWETDDNGLGGYLMQDRMGVARSAINLVVGEFKSKINWGLATLDAVNGNGGRILRYITPTDSDATQQSDVATKLAALKPPADTVNAVTRDKTPLMEALQDVWLLGYRAKERDGTLDNANYRPCRKNYVITMTDGFGSSDSDNSRIHNVISSVPAFGVTATDTTVWPQDPYQYGTNPPADYYDKVAAWMYTHSWQAEGAVVADPANSYANVITHHIAFGAKQPMLEDAATKSGGSYIVANNREQLVAAFQQLGLVMTETVSFTAPVVSVDAVNKIQSGDDLYMGLFLPESGTYWSGNVKKFKLGNGTTTRPKLFMIYDAANAEAIDASGQFYPNTTPFWGTNNASVKDDIKQAGAGEKLLADVKGFFAAGNSGSSTAFWSRPIYTWKNGAMVKFDTDITSTNHITPTDLGLTTELEKNKLINFVHGYTYDANATTGAPVEVRDWILGAIIHSRPLVVDYFNTADTTLPLLKRFIAVGSNDGMFHVFNDTNGQEVFSFIPPDLLPKLKDVQANNMQDTVDGLVTLYRNNKNPKYLIFGERRGGGSFWSLNISCKDTVTHLATSCTSSNIDPLQWTVAWQFTNSEISQSWSEVKVASIPVAIASNGLKSYKDVAIFTGGYDPVEDNFPLPFTDVDNNGTPYKTDGTIDPLEWTGSTYYKYNPNPDTTGRGIFVVDIDNPATVTNVTLADSTTRQILPFSVTYGATSSISPGGAIQQLPTMRYSFPASPSVVVGTDEYAYKDSGTWKTGYKENVLLALYGIDIYTNLFKTRFSFDVENVGSATIPAWQVNATTWTVNKVFNGNPGSTSASGSMGGPTDPMDLTDQGRKAFYPPAISWGGSKGYFEAGNYYFPDVTFKNIKTMASLFFGTGDRENPKYTMIRNRFYAVYDDSSVTATLQPQPPPVVAATPVQITSATYHENNLLNLTCDELGKDTVITSGYTKTELRSLLTDDAVYGSPSALEYGATHENDAKGWYIILADQGKSSVCSHVTYPTTIDASTNTAHDNHAGEEILSQALLYYGTLYFTSYQPSISDSCNPQGNGFTYALNYLDGSAAYNLNQQTDDKVDVTDRYKKFAHIFGIPSGFTIILRDGHAAAMASMGGAIVGPGPDLNNPYEIATPGLGMELYYWRDSNSQQP